MNYLWSAKNSVFILEEMKEQYEKKGWDLTDLRQLDDDIVMKFMSEQPAGKIRETGADGLPCWVNVPPLSHDEEAEAALMQKQTLIDQANNYMNGKQWPGKAALGRLKSEEVIQYNSWLDYLDALEVVDTSSARDINWPESPAF